MTPAVEAAAAAGVTFEVMSYTHDPAHRSYGLEAAEALGLDPWSVFKTLVVRLERGGAHDLAVGVVPVPAQLDIKAVARLAGAKRAEMATPSDAERATGYLLGGISPLGLRRRLPVFIDELVECLDIVHVSAGRRGLELALTPTDLVALTDARVGSIATS